MGPTKKGPTKMGPTKMETPDPMHIPGPGCKFLSDAPGSVVCAESKLANCACVSGCSFLMNLPFIHEVSLFGPFQSYLGPFVSA